MGDFADLFKMATGRQPYAYQERLAADDAMPDVIDLPTGSGKTEAAIISVWLWGRVSGRRDVPRRLVYCLPRRSLVEQTVGRVRSWVKNLGLDGRVGVSQIMGGDSEWDVETEPEREYVLVGTQDMLLSGALNRQYGKGFNTWPMHFALLNNDCLWVMDEVQIMENGLPTSRQLDALRHQMGTFGPCHTIWMSATVNERWLVTPDSGSPESVFRLTDGEMHGGSLGKRNNARKIVRKAAITAGKGYGRDDVRRLLELRRPGTPTAIIVNTVRRAQDIYKGAKEAGAPCILVHSRFRAAERRAINERISKVCKSDDIVIVATQVLEAGVDLSVRTLVTELAPWSSMVQRFGRCNRGAEYDRADVVWLDITDESLMGPYTKAEMDASRVKLESMECGSASPTDLPKIETGMLFDSVLRRRDVVELFGTMEDLTGGRTDASRFVRTSARSLDVDVFWRAEDRESAPHAGEVCAVPISAARKFVRDSGGSIYDHAAGRWVPAGDIRPGQTIMLEGSGGGYSPETGWDPDITEVVDAVVPHAEKTGARAGKRALTLGAHTDHVVCEAERITSELGALGDVLAGAVVEAARYHDIGKAHPVFQKTMVDGGCPDDGGMWAKSPGTARHSRPGFRHEAASALAYLAHHPGRHLVAYIIAAHHGHVRLSMRSTHPDDGHLLGLETSDKLPAYDGGVSMPETGLDLSLAGLGRRGGPSWADMSTRLLDQYGPFRLAYLEMVVRAADWVASRKEGEGAYRTPGAGGGAAGDGVR